MQSGRELQGERETPPWQTEMKEDGEAIRFQDGHSTELTLWMVMDCLYARLPPSLILFVEPAPVALHLTPRSQGLI